MVNINVNNGSNLSVTREITSDVSGILYVFTSLVVLINLPAAIIIIVSIVKKTKIRNVTILSLGVTDLITAVFGFPILETNSNLNISFTGCSIRFFLFTAAYIASIIHIFGICFERICLVCLQIAAIKKHKKFLSVLTIIASWLFALIFCILEFIVREMDNYDSHEKSCSVIRVLPSGPLFTVYILTTFQAGIIICMVILVVFLAKHQRQMKLSNIRKVSKNETRRSMTVCVIVAICAIFNIPLIVVLFYGCYDVMPSRLVRNVTFMIAGFNSCVNPIIYIFRIREYRQILASVLFKLKCCKNAVAPMSETNPVPISNIHLNLS